MDIGIRSLHPAAADHSVSIRVSRCTTLIMLSLRSRAGDPAAQWWYSNCATRYSNAVPPSGIEGYIRNRDVLFQSVTPNHIGWPTIPTKAPQELPLPAPCVGLLILPIRQTIGPGYTEKVNYCCPSSNPNSRTWITLGKCALLLERGTLRSHLLPEGVKWHLLTWSNPVGPYCTWNSLRWLRVHH